MNGYLFGALCVVAVGLVVLAVVLYSLLAKKMYARDSAVVRGTGAGTAAGTPLPPENQVSAEKKVNGARP